MFGDVIILSSRSGKTGLSPWGKFLAPAAIGCKEYNKTAIFQ